MSAVDATDLTKTIACGEGERIEFKESLSGTSREGIRRAICAFANERTLNEKRRYGDLPFDLHPVPSAAVTDLDMARFENEYLPGAFSPETLAANQRTRTEQLAATSMVASVDDPVPTVAGLLSIGKRPQDFIPGSYVQFLRFHGNELTDEVIDSVEIGGAVPDMLRRLDEKLAAHNRTAVDFASRFREERASVFPMEVMNPGGPFGRVTAANFGRGGLVDYRNPNLASAMRVLGFVQKFGIGIALARDELARAGHPEPDFQVDANDVRVVVWRKDAG